MGDPDMDGAPLGVQAAKTLANRRQDRLGCVIHRTRATAKDPDDRDNGQDNDQESGHEGRLKP
jgi:hypothetical protein